MADQPAFFLALACALFAVGACGVVLRRNPLVMFMGIELMLNAANLALVTFARHPLVPGATQDGQAFVFVVMIVAAAEAVVGLAILIQIFRRRHRVDVDELAALGG